MAETVRLKTTQIEQARAIIQKAQGNICPLCERKFSTKVVGCLDHDHKTGYIRGVLCRACNRFEGQVNNRVNMAGASADAVKFLENLAAYWKKHSVPQTAYLHPTHKTDEEKRLARNAAAVKRRAAAKKKVDK